ncbi:MAG: helix-turn-helix domain-containing protein [Sphaerochaetaceae bacterium]|nr:helix-turn-helix domain-containing protein [Sphaerochaetaceae bacterium]
MNSYVTGLIIKDLREKRALTQNQLGNILNVSDKTISKWETGRGYPDITMLEPLAKALGISIIELLSGKSVENTNKRANINKTKLYVCPVCGNIISSTGEAVISCCGIVLPSEEAEVPDSEHEIRVEISDGEYFVSMNHEMSKTHYISFLAFMGDDNLRIVKMYPEWNCQGRFPIRGRGKIYAYCNHHGLFAIDVRPPRVKHEINPLVQ